MRGFRRRLFIPAVLLYCCLRYAGSGEPARSGAPGDDATGPLLVILDQENLPYSSRRGAPPGLDAEIARALAVQLDVEIEILWVNTLDEGHLTPLILGSPLPDFAVGAPVEPSLVEDEVRVGREVIFSVPYASTRYVLVTRKDRPRLARFEDVGRELLGVEIGSVASKLLRERGYLMRRYGSQDLILKALAEGRLNIGVLWSNAGWQIDQDPKWNESLMLHRAEPGMSGLAWNLAVAVAPSSRRLLERIDRAIGAMRRERVFVLLYEKYKIPYFEPFDEEQERR